MKPIVLVITIAVLFAFWEHYLFRHFLGTFDHKGTAMQKSANGYLFFYRAWPLWSFPLFLGVVITALWKGRAVSRSRQRLKLLEKERVRQQAALHDLEAALRTCQREAVLADYSADDDAPEKVRELVQSYDELKENYLASLNLIEKLLLKIKE
ncbi:hypothetical protein [Legionella spiritensis]|uniref:hypothetical protein n=1 Tax=Legionella spiritensis TaxID=452 RepID=UPI000F849CEA|nr:hypothetical protein [Legionella spiritensis]